MSSIQKFYEERYGSVMQRLRFELNVRYLYHDCRHTEDVVRQVQEIANREGVNDYEVALLKVAALYHDVGFLRQREDHEAVSVEMFVAESAGAGITPEDQQRISGLIMVTKVPQQPKNNLEAIICDADLDYLGREDFPVIAEYLYLEFKTCGVVDNRKRWNEIQLSFLENHRFHTESSRKLRTEGLQRNVEYVKRILMGL